MKKPTQVQKLKAEVEKLGKELDLQLEGNENLYDQFTMMLDGARPPKGLLTTVEALEPFVRFAKDVVALADSKKHTDDAGVLVESYGFAGLWAETAQDLESNRPRLTVGYFRDAAATLAWVKGVKELRKSTEQAEKKARKR